MIEPRASIPPLQAPDNPPGGVRPALLLALCVGMVACMIAAAYMARTPRVIGPLVQQRLSGLAAAHQVNLTVNTFRPHGFTGLRLEQVQLVARRGSYLLKADLDAVIVTPSLGELVDGLRVYPSSVEVDGGRIHITRAPPVPPEEPDEATDDSPPSAPPPPAASPQQPAPKTPPAARKTRAILHDVNVSVRPAPLPGTTRPLTLHRAELVLSTGDDSPVDFRSGYGRLPDATPFAVRQMGGAGPDTYIIEPETPTRVDRWFAAPMPAAASVGEMTVCPQCAPARVELIDLDVSAPSGHRGRTNRLQVEASTSEVRLGLSEVAFENQQRELPYRVRDLEAVYDAPSHTTAVQGAVLDDDAGTASFSSSWFGQWGVLETNVGLDDFHTGALWGEAGLEQHVGGGVHSGRIEASFQPSMDLVEVALELDSRELTLDVPVVTDEPLDFGSLGLHLDAVLQPRARTVSVITGEARLGGASSGHTSPIQFGGYAIDAGQSWSFEAYAAADGLDPQRLRDGLPPTIARLARGTEFGGEFGFDIRSAGHTAFPESVTLSVDFSGEVEVGGDSGYADVLALAADGPPSIELPGPLGRDVAPDAWVAYEELPEHVPQVLTAAEDAKFFSHDGFDWRGLRSALVQNVKQGGIARGGSTLSQQLSKNLFLDHERTLARKLQEAYVTWRLESELSKERILELYMNLVDWGPNLQGLTEAADRYFGLAPDELSVEQVALLASVLPGPSLFGQQVLSGYLPSSRLEKIEHILSNLRYLGVISAREYRDVFARAMAGDIGGLDLEVCDDDGKSAETTPKCP